MGEPAEERQATGGKRGGSSMEKRDPLPAFFPRGPGAQYFEVQASESRPAMPSGDLDLDAIKKELGQAIQQAEEEERRQIIEPKEAREPNSWLCRVGWVDHLGHFDKKELRELVPPVKEDEPELQMLYKAFD